MSTPFDINAPLPPNSDVVINHEDGSQTVGTPDELKAAVADNDVIGVPGIAHNPEQEADYTAPAPAEEETSSEEVAEPAEEPAVETPVEAPAEEPAEPVEEPETKPAGK